MFDPMERGRQIREERQHRGCGFCGLADKGEKSQPYQGLNPNPQVADKLRTIADNMPLDKIRKSSANHPQATKPTTTGLSANPQNPQGGKPADNATHDEVETILAGLAAAGRDLGTVESPARWTTQGLSREAAAELAVALDDAFEVAADDRAARAQCRRLLNNPDALAAAKAVWPDLPPPPPDAPAPARPTGRPAVDHTPRWLRLIRERCPLLPEDEAHIRRHLGRLAPGDALALAERYAAAWERAAADADPVRRDNAGRFAANQALLSVPGRPLPSAGGGKVRQQQSDITLAPGERMAWHLSIDGKPVVLAGKAATQAQALESARARWPCSVVEIVE